VLPNFYLKYSINRYRNISSIYSTDLRPPSPGLLNPVIDNNDPVNLKEGNPDLKMELAHNLRLHYMSVDPYLHSNFFAFISARFFRNRISYQEETDSVGRRKSRPINVRESYDLSLHSNWGRPVRLIGCMVYLNGAYFISTTSTLLNGRVNKITNHTIEGGVSIQKKLSFIDFQTGFDFKQQIAKYSVQNNLSSKNFEMIYTVAANTAPLLGFSIGTEATFIKPSGYSQEWNKSRLNWNLGMGRLVFKNKRGEIKIQGMNLFNQKTGLTRNANQNFVEDIQSNTLGRYILLRFTYQVSKFGK
jgi:Outer membrane protein beta-barrel family